jgi:MFS family permease
MAQTTQFWIMYLMMTMVATGGLMATAQLNPMAIDYGVDKFPVQFLWVALPALQFALAADRVINGLCRPFWGWISDMIGREKTMTIAFGLESLAIFGLINFAHDPVLFVIFTAFTFFGWGEIYSLMPAMCGDFFGRKYATTNYGFLYTAKGTASVFVPIGSALAAGKAFDFRADLLLLAGGLLIFFTMYLGPALLRMTLSSNTRVILYVVGGALILYGLLLTVVPGVWTPFAAKLNVPNIGWGGVFAIAAIFDLCAALIAFLVLRRMQVPAGGEETAAEESQVSVTRSVAAGAAD